MPFSRILTVGLFTGLFVLLSPAYGQSFPFLENGTILVNGQEIAPTFWNSTGYDERDLTPVDGNKLDYPPPRPNTVHPCDWLSYWGFGPCRDRSIYNWPGCSRLGYQIQTALNGPQPQPETVVVQEVPTPTTTIPQTQVAIPQPVILPPSFVPTAQRTVIPRPNTVVQTPRPDATVRRTPNPPIARATVQARAPAAAAPRPVQPIVIYMRSAPSISIDASSQETHEMDSARRETLQDRQYIAIANEHYDEKGYCDCYFCKKAKKIIDERKSLTLPDSASRITRPANPLYTVPDYHSMQPTEQRDAVAAALPFGAGEGATRPSASSSFEAPARTTGPDDIIRMRARGGNPAPPPAINNDVHRIGQRLKQVAPRAPSTIARGATVEAPRNGEVKSGFRRFR